MEELLPDNPGIAERRRRWPGPCPDEERRAEPLADLETDQEPDQSPLLNVETTPRTG